MILNPVDSAIILFYLVAVVTLGWALSRRAGVNMESYFLGGKSLPWYILGISHGASGFDITGTMWFVMIFFIYGVKGAWILWIWPMFAMIFRMIYLGPWIRRSNVLTGAEWMRTRFGRGRGGDLAHLSVVAYAVVSVIGFLTYAFKGIGKFAAVFLPWDVSPDLYATVILSVTAAYLIVGGLYSVVLTDLIQYGLLAASAVAIALVAMDQTTPESIAAAVPEGWKDFFFGLRLDLDWSSLIPALEDVMAADGWSLFTLFVMMLLFKGVLVSLAGPAPGYGIQHVLATRNPKEAALESMWISVMAFFPRFMLISSIVVLGLVHFSPELNAMGSAVDFEQILPHVISRFLPIGVVGVVLSGLLAAFMSTFDSTVNAGTAYIVNDIYKRYIRPDAPARSYVKVSYLCSMTVVAVGMAFGFAAESIHSVTQWIVSGLFGGYTVPNILKWHWWRFNGHGFFSGMIAGVIAALAFPALFPSLSALHAFPFILAISAAASVAVCLRTEPENEELLKSFYLTVRPWGFWGPVHRRLAREIPGLEPNRHFRRDMVNCAVGISWQTSLVTTPIYLVLREKVALALSVCALLLFSLFLKFNWYDKLGKGDMTLTDFPNALAENNSVENPRC